MRSRPWPPMIAATALACAPSAVSFGPLRAALTPVLASPRISGISDRAHVALTFDDGPDVRSTPQFLNLLASLEVRATFFVLGRHLGDLGLVREMAGAGHELGVHGWDHRSVISHGPNGLRDDIRDTRDLIQDATGQAVRWYRPPYGVTTVHSRWAARQNGLETILWSAWGRDWERRATARSVLELVSSQLRPGGTVLLHDSDRTSAPGSWHATLAATEHLVGAWRDRGLGVGPLAEHWTRSTDVPR